MRMLLEDVESLVNAFTSMDINMDVAQLRSLYCDHCSITKLVRANHSTLRELQQGDFPNHGQPDHSPELSIIEPPLNTMLSERNLLHSIHLEPNNVVDDQSSGSYVVVNERSYWSKLDTLLDRSLGVEVEVIHRAVAEKTLRFASNVEQERHFPHINTGSFLLVLYFSYLLNILDGCLANESDVATLL
ncbi:hypothetical protein C8J57DRAFT_1227279 [Mycena rebaudengoi]|nr:hypothetical protein C8J57DRAFT_1227279 [Mycena rebaudengoi]